MKLRQIIIIENDEHLDYTDINPNTREKLQKYKPHFQQWGTQEIKKGEHPQSVIDAIEYNVIKGRWLEAESFIMENPGLAYNYALRIIGGRWPEAEPYIMKNPVTAFYYARYVIGGRWPEAEPYIMQGPYAVVYERFILRRESNSTDGQVYVIPHTSPRNFLRR